MVFPEGSFLTCQRQLLRHLNQGPGWRPEKPMALAPGLAALSSTGCLDSLILSTQLGEAFLSHQAIAYQGFS